VACSRMSVSLHKSVKAMDGHEGGYTHIRDSALRGVVPDETGTRAMRSRRRDVDYGAALALLDHAGHEGLHAKEDALDVDVEDALPFLLGHFEGGLRIPLADAPCMHIEVGISRKNGTHLIPVRRPRIVDEDVQPAELGEGEVDDGLPVVGLGDVLLLEHQVRRVLGRDLLAALDVDVGEDDLGALLAEPAGDGGAESRASSCIHRGVCQPRLFRGGT